MQRRLNLACGLLGEPRVVLLDEATVGVDPQSLESIVAALRRHKDRGAALLYSTHHMKEAEQLCDRVVLIDHGRVIALGTPQEVVAQAGLELAADVVTERSLPERWLEGLDGAQVLESHPRGLDETAASRASRSPSSRSRRACSPPPRATARCASCTCSVRVCTTRSWRSLGARRAIRINRRVAPGDRFEGSARCCTATVSRSRSSRLRRSS